MKEYMVYVHIDNITEEVFYVGKGSYNINNNYYRPTDVGKNRRNKVWHEYVKKINSDYRVEIVETFYDEKKAFKFEKELQEFYWSIGQAKCSLTCGGKRNKVEDSPITKEVGEYICKF